MQQHSVDAAGPSAFLYDVNESAVLRARVLGVLTADVCHTTDKYMFDAVLCMLGMPLA